MAWVTVPAPVAGTPVSDTGFGIGVAGNLAILGAAWTGYVPTWTAVTTNPTLPLSLTGRYLLTGPGSGAGTVDFFIQMTAGASTTFGSGSWLFLLPIAPKFTRWSFTGNALDSSAAVSYHIEGETNGATQISMQSISGATYVGLTATAPFTWATGDILTISGRYEAL